MKDWTYKTDSSTVLNSSSKKVSITTYEIQMDGSIFCPECHTNLVKVPKTKSTFTDGRKAYFAHLEKYNDVSCNKRAPKHKPIDPNSVIIIDGFMIDPPPKRKPSESEPTGQQRAINKISTVKRICDNFEINLERYYRFPGNNKPIMLRDALVRTRDVYKPDNTPRLYFAA